MLQVVGESQVGLGQQVVSELQARLKQKVVLE